MGKADLIQDASWTLRILSLKWILDDMLNAETLTRRWETATRFYEAKIMSDLLGDMVLEKIWGSLHSRRGGCRVVALGADACQKGIRLIERERARRGYREVTVSRAGC